jgi:N6-L-threonylcarbamoyladenine synthase/tRNA threonylcarbamoyladenosine biosynthesis protein TsaB
VSKILATDSSTSQRTHSEFINPAIERCLKQSGLELQDIDAFACGSGPGSFTGLRVAANIAKTFSMTFQKPLVVVDSLTLLMLEARARGAAQDQILCLINAHKNMNYLALFNGFKVEKAPCAMTMQEMNQWQFQTEGPVLCVGEGYRAYEKLLSDSFKAQIIRREDHSDFPLATTLGLSTEERLKNSQTIEWNLFEPLYIRASEAEENQRFKSH